MRARSFGFGVGWERCREAPSCVACGSADDVQHCLEGGGCPCPLLAVTALPESRGAPKVTCSLSGDSASVKNACVGSGGGRVNALGRPPLRPGLLPAPIGCLAQTQRGPWVRWRSRRPRAGRQTRLHGVRLSRVSWPSPPSPAPVFLHLAPERRSRRGLNRPYACAFAAAQFPRAPSHPFW